MSTQKTTKKKQTKTEKTKDKLKITDFAKFMKDWKKDNKFKKWIEGKFNETLGHFIFDFYRIKVGYAKHGEFFQDGEVMFRVSVSKKYHRINISVFPLAYRLYRENNIEEIMEGIIHELAHAHTTHLTSLALERFIRKEEIIDECEHLTEIMAEYVRRTIKK